MMFEMRAREVAASSAVRFVVSPRSIIVLVNAATSSALMPSWPAASATPAISVCVAGRVVARPRSWLSSSGREVVAVALTVLVTPVQALSQSIAAFVTSPRPPAATSPTLPAAVPSVVRPARIFAPLASRPVSSPCQTCDTDAEAADIDACKPLISPWKTYFTTRSATGSPRFGVRCSDDWEHPLGLGVVLGGIALWRLGSPLAAGS